MTERKYITLEDGREVPAEDYMMAYAPLSVVKRVCEPAVIKRKPSAPLPNGGRASASALPDDR